MTIRRNATTKEDRCYCKNRKRDNFHNFLRKWKQRTRAMQIRTKGRAEEIEGWEEGAGREFIKV